MSPATFGGSTRRALAGLDAARVAVLGSNAWAVLVLFPFVLSDAPSVSALLAVSVPLAFLAAGALALATAHAAAPYLTLGAFPTALVGAVAALDGLGPASRGPDLGTIVGALSLLAYLGFAAEAAARPAAVKPSTVRPIGGMPPLADAPRRVWLRRALLGAAFVGGFALAVIAPLSPGRAGYRDAFGEAANEAFVLTAVVGASLGCAVATLFIGPGLRAARGVSTPAARRRQASFLLALFAVGVALTAFYLLVAR